jgi:hypothetical protein
MFLIPFIPIRTNQPVEIYNALSNYELLLIQAFYMPVETGVVKAGLNWADIVVFIYLLGVSFFILRYIYFVIRIGLLMRNGEKSNLENGVSLVILEKEITPFSWMKSILISKKDYSENRESILKHELAHIKHRHAFDLLLAEIFAIIQWYNPAIWLIKNELKDIHEYEADDAVLDSGVNVKQYQLLLIAKAVGSQRFNSMTNSFNHSKLKKRITMMMRKKTSRWARLKYLTILPLAAFAVTIFARPEVSNKLDEISEVKVSNFTSIIEEKWGEISAPEQTEEKRKVVSRTDVKVLPDDSVQFYLSEALRGLDSLRLDLDSLQFKLRGDFHNFFNDSTQFQSLMDLGKLDSLRFMNLDSIQFSLKDLDNHFSDSIRFKVRGDFHYFSNDSVQFQLLSDLEKLKLAGIDSTILKNLPTIMDSVESQLKIIGTYVTCDDSIQTKNNPEHFYFQKVPAKKAGRP